MKKFVEKIHTYFIPTSYMVDEKEFRKARILVNISIITSLFACVYVVQSYLFEQYHIMTMMLIWAVLFFSLIFLFKYSVPRKVCANLYVSITLISALWEIYWTGGISSSIVPWLSMTPVTAILLNTPRNAWIWFYISITAISGVFIASLYIEFPIEMNMSYYDFSLYLAYVGLVAIMFTIAILMEKAFVGSLTKLDQKNKDLDLEKQKSDDLLLNILPLEVMEELKQTGRTEAKNYSLVTVLFADFKDFTTIIEEITPEELVGGLAEYFELFDNIIEKYDIEKIKTVGDAYICASGLPAPNIENPVIMIKAAMEILESVQKLNQTRSAQGKIIFEIRIGINSGPLVAGVVGIKKFAYDIWGDTVNTAQRMEQNGEQGKVNISGTTYNLVKHRFKCVHRGKIDAKHKGEIDMYFVENPL